MSSDEDQQSRSAKRPRAPPSGPKARKSDHFLALPTNPYEDAHILALMSLHFSAYPEDVDPNAARLSQASSELLRHVPDEIKGVRFGLPVKKAAEWKKAASAEMLSVADTWCQPFDSLCHSIISMLCVRKKAGPWALYEYAMRNGRQAKDYPGLKGWPICSAGEEFKDIDGGYDLDGNFKHPTGLKRVASAIIFPLPFAIDMLYILFLKRPFLNQEKLLPNGRPKLQEGMSLSSLVRPEYAKWWEKFSKSYLTRELYKQLERDMERRDKLNKAIPKYIDDLVRQATDDPAADESKTYALLHKLHRDLAALTELLGAIEPHIDEDVLHPKRLRLVELSADSSYLEKLLSDEDEYVQEALQEIHESPEGDTVEEGVLGLTDLESRGVPELKQGHVVEAQGLKDLPDAGMTFWHGVGNQDVLLKWAGNKEGWPGISKTDRSVSRQKQVQLKIREHQMTGGLEIIARAYSGGAGGTEYQKGVIVADATSLGKTLQGLMVICYFAALSRHYLHDPNPRRGSYPPICLPSLSGLSAANPPGYLGQAQMKEHTGWAGTGKIAPPCSPSIVVAAPDIIENYDKESRRCTTSLKVFKIVSKAGASDKLAVIRRKLAEWQRAVKSGTEAQVDNPANFLILVTQRVLTELYKDHLTDKKAPSFFRLDYSTAILDEAHNLRTAGINHTAVHCLTARAGFKIVQTATLLVNSPLDVWHIANAANLPQADDVLNPKDEETEAPVAYLNLLTALKGQTLGGIMKQEGLADHWYRGVRSAGTNYEVNASADNMETSIIGALGLDKSRLPSTNRSISRGLAPLSPYIIRRTRSSVDSQGKPILNLGTVSEHIVSLMLDEEDCNDVEIFLSGRKKEWLARAEARARAKGKRFVDKGRSKWGVAYNDARAVSIAPSFFARRYKKGPQPALRRCGNKISVVLNLMDIHRKRQELEGVPLKDRHKFLVWCDSKEVADEFLIQARRYKVHVRTFTGDTSKKKREELFEEVNKDGKHRADDKSKETDILFCSPVGQEGISFHRFDVVIHLTFPWSLSVYLQRLGRSHRTSPNPTRPPLTVFVYSILAYNSADIVFYLATLLKSRVGDQIFGGKGVDIGLIREWIGRLTRGGDAEVVLSPTPPQVDSKYVHPSYNGVQERYARNNKMPELCERSFRIAGASIRMLLKVEVQGANPEEAEVEIIDLTKKGLDKGEKAQGLKEAEAEAARNVSPDTLITEEDLVRQQGLDTLGWLREAILAQEAQRQYVDIIEPRFASWVSMAGMAETVIEEMAPWYESTEFARAVHQHTGLNTPRIPPPPKTREDLYRWYVAQKAKPSREISDPAERLLRGLLPEPMLPNERMIIDLTHLPDSPARKVQARTKNGQLSIV